MFRSFTRCGCRAGAARAAPPVCLRAAAIAGPDRRKPAPAGTLTPQPRRPPGHRHPPFTGFSGLPEPAARNGW